MLTLLPLSLLSAFLVGLTYPSSSGNGVNAVRLPFQVRTTNPFDSTSSSLSSLSRRSHSKRAPSSATIPVHNTHNAEYISNITLGGRQIPVLLDTGRCVYCFSFSFLAAPTSPLTLHSSDLWVTGDVPNTKDLGKSVSLNYAVGNAHGASECAKSTGRPSN